MREGLTILVRRGHDFMEVGSCLNATKGTHQASFDRILSRLDAAALSLIPLGSGESSKERQQYWGKFWICLSLNTQKYRNSSFK